MLKPAIIALALLTAISPALAKAQKLPFVGTRYFNFAGGMGTEESITITKKGNATVKAGAGSSITLYKGKYKNLLPMEGGEYYYQIKGNTIRMLDKNKKLDYSCEYSANRVNPDSSACILTLSNLD
ncbi:hypothetical protein [Moraxella sp. RCAD0137]|uniref:hypothetical protein n=1 Tax=Moraxella sp. RCAD0137 TaxID=1775913 RepID=UPI000C9F5F8C|nr:hypothetical protein [Moraxella sp. RCAD0137]PNP99056.1 hypothetical protein AZ602_01210 [Moraxella sp. RCAD0137]